MRFVVLISASLLSASCCGATKPPEQFQFDAPSINSIAVKNEEIPELSEAALQGSGEAARRLATHYFVAQGNRDEGLFWALIAAEDGDAVGQYTAGYLLKDSPDPRLKKRAVFWLKKASAQGDTLADSLLKEIEKSSSQHP